ncbi:MAG TPA: bifunctional (p)ppGpp synthetase/guanosine-3',5'-bis(diphosphate) 3'-pyrophosphohydrolase [Gammaproteobacteria bacterium]|nr:bifunctional (p)ppGpp synthetase/guanosine-3',5'-bis(diphosphate) 3'-pyrophosphohydrolase [Gammaproteobacteria bacterium]
MDTATRKRAPAAQTPSVQPLIEKVSGYLPAAGVSLVEKAYAFAAEAHCDQRRLTGEPYIVHPLDAAMTVAGLQLDAAAVAAALLHDVQEDCGVPNEELSKRFGPEVAKLVDGATKLDKIAWRAPGERPGDQALQAENLRKMFLAMAEDIRVVIIKLADRLHNMRTLDAKPPEKRVRTAQETMEIYAPLANRLGIWQLKWELEDLAFRYLEPERYKQIARLIASKRTAREKYVAQVERILGEELAKQGIEAEVKGRAKHIYSIAQKAEKYAAEHKGFEQIYDLLALRVVVNSVSDCYNALGVVHGLWHPMPGQFDDYIASPKESLYQSLHTTVMSIGARPLEVQIRTQEMHQLAEYGVAAHWRYKEGARSDGKRDIRYEERMSWLRQLLEWQRDMSQAEEFVESVKADLFRDQVFVYTPKGEIKEMPVGATPIDFAYRVHTELGHKCVGAKVNGRLVALSYQLKTGDVVEIVAGKNSRGPSRDWLNPNLGYIKTGHSKEKIRQWFKRQEREENIERGREVIEKELRRMNLSWAECQDEVLKIFKYDTTDDFLAALGYGGVTSAAIPMRLAPLIHKEEDATPELPATQGPAPRIYSSTVQVLGTGDLLTQIARCCNPVPGDRIIGYVTRSRGVTVHREDCYNVMHEAEKERLVEVEWGRTGQMYPVAVRIEAWDRVGLLRDVSTMIADEKVNMVGVRTVENPDRSVGVFLTLETTGIPQLSRLMTKLESIRGVVAVTRQIDSRRAAAADGL